MGARSQAGPSRVAVVLLLAASTLLLAAVPASASVEQILSGLRADPLYVSPQSTVSPDRQLVAASLARASPPTFVVVVPQAEADAQELGIDGLTLRLVEGLGAPDGVVLVLTDGQELQAGGGSGTGTLPAAALDRVIGSRLDQPFTPETLTSAIVDFAEQVGSATPADGPREQTATRRTIGIAGLSVVLVLALGGWLHGRSRQRLVGSGQRRDDEETDPGRGSRGVADRQAGT